MLRRNWASRDVKDWAGYFKTSVCFVDPLPAGLPYIRGYSLLDMMGRLSYTEIAFLCIKGRIPSKAEAKVFDAVLSTFIDIALYRCGMVAARYNVSGNPQMNTGVATAILGIGKHTVDCAPAGEFIIEKRKEWKASGLPLEAFAQKLVDLHVANHWFVPGLGGGERHLDVKKYPGKDPRTGKLWEIVKEQGLIGEHVQLMQAIHKTFAVGSERSHLNINVTGGIGPVLADMGFTPPEMTGVSIMYMIPGTIAHIVEEMQQNERIRVVPEFLSEYDKTKRNLEEDLKKRR